MDDACLLTALTYDMNNVLVFFSKCVDWSRFKLKAPKSSALVFKLGKAAKWFLDDVEGASGNARVVDDVESPGGEDMVDGEVVVDEKIYVGDEVIPNVCEKPINFVGRWIREHAKDTAVTSDVQ